MKPDFKQLDLVVRDMDATMALPDWSSGLAKDAAAMRMFLLGSEDSDELEDLERQPFRMLTMGLSRRFENLHFQYSQGTMDQDRWAGWRQTIAGTLGGAGAQLRENNPA